MLDWKAPTRGYLLTACFAAGVAAAQGVPRYLALPGEKSASVNSIGAPCRVRSAA